MNTPNPDFLFIHDGNKFRVWHFDWSGDQFEVLHQSEFAEFQKMCKRFSLFLKEHHDED